PAALRKQWNQELSDKFFLPSVLLEAKSFNQFIKQGNLNPFDQREIVICSYHFARAKDSYVQVVKWDLVIVDEAHRLRNVYKPTNRIANAIKSAIADAPKVLLTATPLQNSIQELYGAIRIIADGRRFCRAPRTHQADLPKDASPAGAGIYQIHEPHSDHARV